LATENIKLLTELSRYFRRVIYKHFAALRLWAKDGPSADSQVYLRILCVRNFAGAGFQLKSFRTE
jgi:hypothetical protein